MELTAPQIERYSRQILLREVGGKGQARLLDATVLLLGAGGLGSPAAYYLAAAGVGHLVIADGDRVERSNLQRQILHTTDRIGQTKAASAARAILELNPEVEVTTFPSQVTSDNIKELIQKVDLVIDGSDTFETRYLLNEACFHAGKTLVSAAVLGFEGQLTTFRHGLYPSSPCYQCLYPSRAPRNLSATPTCATAGVLGALTGITGSWQAAEAVKELLGIGHTLDGSLLLINVLHGLFQRIQIPKDPHCTLCGTKKTD